MQWLAIGLGAAIGACLRAWLGRFNPLHSWILAMVWFQRTGSMLSVNAKMFVITGFCGGLTTFSTFSAEVFSLINAGRMLAGLGLVGLHVGLTLLATAVGFYLFKLVL